MESQKNCKEKSFGSTLVACLSGHSTGRWKVLPLTNEFQGAISRQQTLGELRCRNRVGKLFGALIGSKTSIRNCCCIIRKRFFYGNPLAIQLQYNFSRAFPRSARSKMLAVYHLQNAFSWRVFLEQAERLFSMDIMNQLKIEPKLAEHCCANYCYICPLILLILCLVFKP